MLCRDPKIEAPLQEWFHSYHQWHRGEVPKMTVYWQILHLNDGNNLFANFAQLAAAGPNDPVRKRIAGLGFRTGKGQGYKTALLKYVA